MTESADDSATAPSAVEGDRHAGSRIGKLATAILGVYWLAMFVGTHIPRPELIIGENVSDKLLHFSAYFVLYALLVARSRIIRADWPDTHRQLKYLVITSCYAVADELLQGLPGVNRSPEVLDATADCGGLLSAMGLSLIASRLLPVEAASEV